MKTREELDNIKPFSEQRYTWRKEWNKQAKIKDWYKFLEMKIKQTK